MNQVKAIETKYKGYRFRSRLEARWAVFLDSIFEHWEYEKEGFELSCGRYLPDFWLSRLGCWLEIKGEKPSQEELDRCVALAEEIGEPVAIAWGLPYAVVDPSKGGERLMVYCFDMTDGSAGAQWWEECFLAIDSNHGRLCVCSNNWFSSREFFTLGSGDRGLKPFPGLKQLSNIICPISETHANVAKSARFEHGETP